MFYANPVIRKGYVGLRGAWVAMGIELNFPVGHSLDTVTPISYATTQNNDGSASIWVADVDRKTGLEFRVEYRLQPLSTVLIENVNLYNRGDARQPYYFWSNAEVKIEDQNSRFQFPMYISATHGFSALDTWPVSTKGVDLSIVGNIVDQEAFFAYGSNEPFMSVYHPGPRTGTVHYADATAVPGKKLWAWGSGAYGDSWVLANLTVSSFASYLETQGGVTPNQETHLFLDPQQTSHFTEYWMPARQLDGITRANLNGVLYLGRSGSSLVAELNANEVFNNAQVKILNGSSVVYSETVNLTPATTYTHTLPNASSNASYTFQLSDVSGNVLLTHTEGLYNAAPASSVTLGAQPAVDLSKSDTDQQVLNRADYNERLQQYVFAESDYNLGVTKFPQSAPLRKAAGRLAVAAGRYSDGLSQLTPSDVEAQYYLGLANYGIGEYAAAAATWSGITGSSTFARAAAFELACLAALTGDLNTAATLFDTVNASSPDAVRAAGMQIAVLRHLGQTATASAKLAQWRAIAPTDFFLRYEQTLAGSADDALWLALGAEPERVLNLAEDYFRLGFYADAVTLLSRTYPDVPALQREPGSTTPQNSPLVAYYRGYARQQAGGSGASDFAAASALALPYVFPNRLSSVPVLQAAIQSNAADAVAHYLLGLQYMSQRLPAAAIAEWQVARSLHPAGLPALHRNLGRALLDVQGDAVSALPVLRDGLTYEPSNQDLQDAYNRASSAAPAGSNCSYTLSGATSVAASAGGGTVTASPAGSCASRPTSYATWISIGSSANGTFSYTVAANPAPTPRRGALSIGGNLFVVTQAAAACSYALGAAGTLPSSGGPLSLTVSAPAGCAWSLGPSPSWILAAARAGAGNGSLNWTVSANAGAPRTASATVAGQPLTLLQDSAPSFFVNQLYQDLLDRAPDSGASYWTGQVVAGASTRAQVGAQFFTSPEFTNAGLYIIKLYEAVLHRDPDFGGWSFWFNSLAAGTPQSAALNSFLGSNEFQSTYGSLSNTAFVNLVYQNVLGRSPDSAGQVYWVGQLNTGAITRAALMDQFVRSGEFDSLIRPRAYANLLYMGFLRRTPESAGLQYWMQSLAAGNPLAAAVGAFIASPEYVERFLVTVP
jgi:hypothetical protein